MHCSQIHNGGRRVISGVEEAIVYSVSARLSLGPPGGCPRARLKAGTPRESLTPAPTTKTPSPKQRIGKVRGSFKCHHNVQFSGSLS